MATRPVDVDTSSWVHPAGVGAATSRVTWPREDLAHEPIGAALAGAPPHRTGRCAGPCGCRAAPRLRIARTASTATARAVLSRLRARHQAGDPRRGGGSGLFLRYWATSSPYALCASTPTGRSSTPRLVAGRRIMNGCETGVARTVARWRQAGGNSPAHGHAVGHAPARLLALAVAVDPRLEGSYGGAKRR